MLQRRCIQVLHQPFASRPRKYRQCMLRGHQPRLLTFKISGDRKMMSILVRMNGTGALFVKGASEYVPAKYILDLIDGGEVIPVIPVLHATLLERSVDPGTNGLRTLPLA